MFRILAVFFVVFISISGLRAQSEQGYLEIKGSITVDDLGLAGADVFIKKNGNQVGKLDTDKSGKFSYKLDLNSTYDITVQKPGYFKKIIQVNTKVDPSEVGIFNYRFSMELLRFLEGFDASLFEEYIGKISFDDGIGAFDYDLEYTQAMKKRIAAMMKEYEKAKKAAYSKIIAQADAALKEKDYDKAIELYDFAIDIDPYDPYPDDQIALIGRLRKDEEKDQKNYDKNIKEADRYLAEKDYNNAKNYYNRALSIKDESYPKNQIANIDQILAGNNANTEQLAAQQREYQNAIAAADRAFTAQKYNDALAKYQEAQKLLPNEAYPPKRIAETEALIAELEKANANQAALDKAYNDAIALGDKQFTAKQLADARTNFVKAQGFKPKEAYPKTKIAEIDKLLADDAAAQQKYQQFIAQADKQFGTKDYQAAKNNYNQALGLKPQEAYPAGKIKEIDALLAQLGAKEAQKLDDAYRQAIAQADAFFQQKSYTQSKDSYENALAVKPAEAYPKQRIAEIDKILADLAAKRRGYDLLIANADNAYNAEKLEQARVDYQKASDVFPDETYPKNRIAEIDNRLMAMKSAAEQKLAIDKAYNTAIHRADSLLNRKEYELSRNSYQKASDLKTAEAYPKNKIKEINKILDEQNALLAKYNRYIELADNQFISQQYQSARGNYVEAQKVMPEQTYPPQKIKEIDQLLADAAAKAASDRQRDEQYTRLIAEADGLYKQQQWDGALAKYKEALVLKPAEEHPGRRKVEIENLLTAMAEKNKRYSDFIAQGDQLFLAKNYTEALTAFNGALGVKPEEAYPKKKIEEIQAIFKDAQAKEVAYAQYISSADNAFKNNQLPEARNFYASALGVKPNEGYPKQRIQEIDALLTEQARNKAERERIDAEYNALIASADQLFTAKDYIAAKGKYKAAGIVKPAESYPNQRIAEIENILLALANEKAAYEKAIARGGEMEKQNNLTEAIDAYREASRVRPNEQFPKGKIAQLESRMAEIAAKQKAYNDFVKKADDGLAAKDYTTARSNYVSASGVYPDEAYPKTKIQEIDNLLAEQARNKAERDRIEAEYKALITSADQLFTAKDYNGAKEKYKAAGVVKPAEAYPNQRIAEIENILLALANEKAAYERAIARGGEMEKQNNLSEALDAYREASRVRPNEQFPKGKIAQLESKLAEIAAKQKAYNDFVKKADDGLAAKDYNTARSNYVSASGVYPDEAYPKTKIQEIDNLLADQARMKAEKDKVDAQYAQLISEADGYFNQKNYEGAKPKYQSASEVKQNENYPKNRLAEIDKILKDQMAVQTAYDAAVARAENFYKEKNYRSSIQSFTEASSIKPSENMPKQRIEEIKALMAKEEADNKMYAEYISQADTKFNAKEYKACIDLYNNALLIKSDEAYPKNQIKVASSYLGEQERQAAEQQRILAAYNAKVAEADKLRKEEKFDAAVFAYQEAQKIKSDEAYPGEQIDAIRNLLANRQKELDLAFDNAIKQGDSQLDGKDYDNARLSYEKAKGLKPESAVPPTKLAKLDNLIAQDKAALDRKKKLDSDYNNAIAVADNAYKGGKFNDAMTYYKNALNLKPGEQYPKDQIDKCDAAIRAANLASKQAKEEKKDDKDFDYSGEKREKAFLNELAKQYPEGITVEKFDKKNKKITRVIVNNGGIAKEYIQVDYSYGTFYFRNGENISRSIFMRETSKD